MKHFFQQHKKLHLWLLADLCLLAAFWLCRGQQAWMNALARHVTVPLRRAIGQVCYVNKVPFAVIRVISDDANGNSPQDYPAFAVQAGQTGMEITLAVMKALGGN